MQLTDRRPSGPAWQAAVGLPWPPFGPSAARNLGSRDPCEADNWRRRGKVIELSPQIDTKATDAGHGSRSRDRAAYLHAHATDATGWRHSR